LFCGRGYEQIEAFLKFASASKLNDFLDELIDGVGISWKIPDENVSQRVIALLSVHELDDPTTVLAAVFAFAVDLEGVALGLVMVLAADLLLQPVDFG